MDERTAGLYSRLRREPVPNSIPGSLPVLFFGDPTSAAAATIALNPSHREYCAASSSPDAAGPPLIGSAQRLASLMSLGASSRDALTDEQCAEALRWMQEYFQPRRPSYAYFGHLERVLEGAGFSYRAGSAIHLDLVQEATFPMWGALDPQVRDSLMERDVPFLSWELATLPLKVVFANGETVSNTLGPHIQERGVFGKLRWWVGTVESVQGWTPAAGWNLPLNQPTGLSAVQEVELGRLLGPKLHALVEEAELARFVPVFIGQPNEMGCYVNGIDPAATQAKWEAEGLSGSWSARYYGAGSK